MPTTYSFGGFEPPLSSESLKIFKLNRTIPVKFRVARNDGTPHDDIIARLTLQQMDNAIPIGNPIDPVASGAVHDDGVFRYDQEADQYIYNLSTKDLTTGTWELQVVLDDGSQKEMQFGLK
ncbi:MAG: PxKF domain-containing protein [bacterium]|nr:PxKF domain-containing protein [bacterium]